MLSEIFDQFLSVFYYSYLVLYPFFSALSGLVLVLSGVFTWYFWAKLNVECVHDDLYTTILGFIVIGVILTILPFLLCCASTNASKSWMATTYVVITLVMLVSEMSFGVFLSAVPERTKNKTRISLTATFDNSSFNDSLTANYSRARATVDMIQLHFNCCGVDGPLYWIKRNNMNSSLSLPLSCCKDVSQNLTCSPTKAWPNSCLQRSVALITETSHLLFIIVISIAVVKMIGILFFVVKHDWNGKKLSESSSLLYTNNR